MKIYLSVFFYCVTQFISCRGLTIVKEDLFLDTEKSKPDLALFQNDFFYKIFEFSEKRNCVLKGRLLMYNM